MCVQNQQTHLCLCRKLLLLKTVPQVLASVPASGLREVGPHVHCWPTVPCGYWCCSGSLYSVILSPPHPGCRGLGE